MRTRLLLLPGAGLLGLLAAAPAVAPACGRVFYAPPPVYYYPPPGAYYAPPVYAQQPLYAAPPAGAPASPADAAPVKRGDYLVNRVAHCDDCHTPRDAKGQPDLVRSLQGATLPIMPKEKTEHWADKSPDITSSGLAGKLTEEQMVKFLMTGIDPNGEKARPPMPQFRLEPDDARAVVLYLKSLPGAKSK